MRIESSDMALHSQHRLHREETSQMRLTRTAPVVADPPATPRVTSPPGLQEAARETALDPEDSLRLGILNALLKRLLGEQFQVRTLQDFTSPPAPEAPPPATPASRPPATGVAIEFTATRLERESLQFHAAGRVVTSDGREIELAVQLNMSRTLFTRVEARLGSAPETKDPLMLSLDGTAPTLSAARFEFDLDADGRTEAIPTPALGSAFLAHDGDGDGRINDGRELFGARTGDGFGELARHDDDGNGWIDEADAVYRELRVWQVGADGRGTLVALGDLDIGAIYLGNVATPFQLGDARDGLLGLLRESGVYLREDGTPGTLHQVDLVV